MLGETCVRQRSKAMCLVAIGRQSERLGGGIRGKLPLLGDEMLLCLAPQLQSRGTVGREARPASECSRTLITATTAKTSAASFKS